MLNTCTQRTCRGLWNTEEPGGLFTPQKQKQVKWGPGLLLWERPRQVPPPPNARKQWVPSKSTTAIARDPGQCFRRGSSSDAWQSAFPMLGHSVTATLPSRDVVLHCLCADRSQMPSSAPNENSLPLPQLGPVISQARDTPALCVGSREPPLCTRL